MRDRIKRSLIRLSAFRRWIILYFLDIFRKPKVKEEIGKLAGKFQSEAGRFTSGMKSEAVGTREMFIILARYIRKEHLSRAEKKIFKRQVINMLKSTGVVVPVMLIPLPFVSTLLLIIMDHLLLSMNIKILPSSFYPGKTGDLLTRESVEKELHRSVNKSYTGTTDQSL